MTMAGLRIKGLAVAGILVAWLLTWRRDPAAAQPARETAADPYPMPAALRSVELLRQPKAVADAKSVGCIQCHEHTHDPHFGPERITSFHLGCVDCHGGDPNAITKEHAHVAPRFPEAWRSSANPIRIYTLLNHETPEF